MITYGISLIVLSLIAVPSLILAKRPDAKELLDKVAPYQGWIGIVFCFWGLWGLIETLMAMSLLGAGMAGIIIWVTSLLYSVVEASLGFMLGYNLIAKYVFGKNEAAQAKGQQILEKLQPLQGKIGILGLIVGAWCIVAAIIR